ncbi:hypothetical protein U9M48_005891 [Paspalum notatum var. saurae]|uniref:F-box domain-containing protein n=1 Tax=Paspalum notatum var. saurae TaxID=547442 RepID=A0AAQ3PR39_PASNO
MLLFCPADTQCQSNARRSDWCFTFSSLISDLCYPNRGYLVNDTILVEAEVAIGRMADHWMNDSIMENDLISSKNHGASCHVNSFRRTLYQTRHIKNVMHHMPTANNDMLHGSIPVGSLSLLFKFRYGDSSVATKKCTKSFQWGIVNFFLQRIVLELNMGTVQEGKIGQLFAGHPIDYSDIYANYKSSRKECFIGSQNNLKGCHDVYSPFYKYIEVKDLECDGRHEYHGIEDLHPLHPEKSKDDIVLFFESCSLEKELCFVRRHFVKASEKPSEILTNINKMPEFLPYEGVELCGAGVKYVLAVISCKFSQELTFVVLHPSIQLRKQLCRRNSSSKRLETAASGVPELSQDILMDIFALLEIPDLLRAASVCSSWKAAYYSVRSIGHYRRAQTPCLIYTSICAGENVTCLYSLAEKRTYRLTHLDPPIHKRYLIGSSHGWLVTADERSEMHLVNPVTSEQIALPSVITIEHVTPVFDDSGALCKYEYSQHTARSVSRRSLTLDLGVLRDILQRKALLFYDTSAGSYIVVLLHNPFGQLSFTRLGDEKWTWLPARTEVDDCIYKDGLLYAVTLFGEIVAFDLSGTGAVTKVIMGRIYCSCNVERVYIVEAPWGDLLQVWRPEVWIEDDQDEHGHSACGDRALFGNNTVTMKIYKICIATKEMVEINSLDDHVLFLGHNQSLCSRAEEYPQLKPNHVYFTDDAGCVSSKSRLGYHFVIGALNFENKSVEEIILPRSNCPAPLLVTPNPGKMDSAYQSLRI